MRIQVQIQRTFYSIWPLLQLCHTLKRSVSIREKRTRGRGSVPGYGTSSVKNEERSRVDRHHRLVCYFGNTLGNTVHFFLGLWNGCPVRHFVPRRHRARNVIRCALCSAVCCRWRIWVPLLVVDYHIWDRGARIFCPTTTLGFVENQSWRESMSSSGWWPSL